MREIVEPEHHKKCRCASCEGKRAGREAAQIFRERLASPAPPLTHELDAKGLKAAHEEFRRQMFSPDDAQDRDNLAAAIRAYIGNAEAVVCAECRGSGQVEYEVDIGPGYATQRSQCVKCKGTGRAPAPPPSASEELVRALNSTIEYFDTLNEWFAQRKAGEETTNSEQTMFEQVHWRLGLLESAALSRAREAV